VAHHIRFINPKSISKPPGYTHVVEVTGPGRTIYTEVAAVRAFNLSKEQRKRLLVRERS
jgi:hypothetical protein